MAEKKNTASLAQLDVFYLIHSKSHRTSKNSKETVYNSHDLSIPKMQWVEAAIKLEAGSNFNSQDTDATTGLPAQQKVTSTPHYC